MIEFKYHVSSELTSLGAFSFTIIISTLVQICAIASIIGTRRLMAFLFPLTTIIYVVFSSALFMITYYLSQNTYFASSLPYWTYILLYGIAIMILIMAMLGYVTYKNISSFLLTIYIVYNAITGILFFICICLLIIGEKNIKDI